LRHRAGGGFRQRGPRRQTEWVTGPGLATGLQAPFSASGPALVNGRFDFGTDATLVRLRGRMRLILDTSTALGGYVGAFGIAKVTTAAATVGVSAIPTPVTEALWDGWLYHQHIQLISGDAIAGSGVSLAGNQANGTTAALDLVIDSKAMRKFENLESIVAVMELTELGTATMNWMVDTRFLVKLH